MAAPNYVGLFNDVAEVSLILNKPKGYHTTFIKKGVFGEVTKIEEEVQELQDAIKQKNKIMALVELSDLVGAIKGYLVKNYPGFSLEDLNVMAEVTSRAFRDGTRK